MDLYPLKFQPIYKERIWGGRRLAELFGRPLPAGERIGESWELCDLPSDKTAIANGPLAGGTISQVVAEFGVELTGRRIEGTFPLLIKLLDAQDTLSIQVHPDRQACERMGKGEPKTECWYIIAAEPGAAIYKGLKPGTTKEQFAEALSQGNCAELLEKVDVQPGQSYFLPAGTCHSIGAGLVIAEIQQSSDTTYRVFDWNRIDPATGKGRPLQIAEAMESINFSLTLDKLPVAAAGRLAECEAFKIDKFRQGRAEQFPLAPGQMKAIVFISGRGKVLGRRSESVYFAAGDTILTPAVFEGFIEFENDCTFLTVTI